MAKAYTGIGGKYEVKPLVTPMAVRAVPVGGDVVKSDKPLVVKLTHEAFLPWLVLECGGETEELSHTEALEWFKEHGAHTEEQWKTVNDMINAALNFGEAEVTIARPVTKRRKYDPVDPQI